MHYDSFFWNSLGKYWGIIVHHPTRAPDVLPESHPLKPCLQSHLIGWHSLEGHVLTSPFSLSSSMNKAFSDYIKQGLFNRSQPWLHPGNRELQSYTQLYTITSPWLMNRAFRHHCRPNQNRQRKVGGTERERIINMMLTSDRPIYFADDIDSFRETLHNCGLTEVDIFTGHFQI